jgi:predicted phage-related endonuclease
MGISSVEDYPYDIVEKYSKVNRVKSLTDEDIEEYDKDLLHRIGELKEEIKVRETECKELEEYAKTHYTDSKYQDEDYKYVISTGERKGGLDEDKLSIEHPDIDLTQYRKPSTTYTQIRVSSRR